VRLHEYIVGLLVFYAFLLLYVAFIPFKYIYEKIYLEE